MLGRRGRAPRRRSGLVAAISSSRVRRKTAISSARSPEPHCDTRRARRAMRRTRPDCRRMSRRTACGASINSARPVTAASGSPPPSALAGGGRSARRRSARSPRSCGYTRSRIAPRRQRDDAVRVAACAGHRWATPDIGMNPPAALYGLEHDAGDLGVVVCLNKSSRPCSAFSVETPRYGYGAGARSTSVASGPKPCL